ncbi:MAG: 50S ribosomal protein L11 methyltransferase [Bryobacteraceae bacterium]
MFSVELEIDAERKDLWIAELWERGSCGLVESEAEGARVRLRAFFDSLDAVDVPPGARIERVEDCDWVAVARGQCEPLLVGERFFLAPAWRDDPTPPGRVRLSVNPGLACGSGAHEATQLCLEALERYLAPSMTTVDVGTGSGILSQAALLLGARRVAAFDVDPEAAAIAAERLPGRVVCGSADSIRTGAADLVLCNIGAAAAVSLAGELVRCLAPGGRCVVSGFEAHEEPAVRTALAAAGAEIESAEQKGSWRALAATRTPSPPRRSVRFPP